MRAFEFTLLIEGFKEAVAEFSQDQPIQLVDLTIKKFRDLVNRNQIQDNEKEKRNIDYWRKQGWSAFKIFVDTRSAEASKTQIKRKKVVGKSITIKEDDKWLVVIPLDKSASCFHGRKSDWCTTKTDQEHFEDYFYRRDIVLIYCLNKQDGSMFAVAGHHDLKDKIEAFDQRDNSITPEQFKAATQLDAYQLVDIALSKYGADIKAAKGPYNEIVRELTARIPVLTGRDPDVEKKLLEVKSSQLILKYVQKTMPGVFSGQYQIPTDFPKALVVSLIKANPQIISYMPHQPEQYQLAAITSLWGASYVKNPTPKVVDQALSRYGGNLDYFPVSYDVLIKYPKAAAYWAKKNRKRVPEAEPAIAKDDHALRDYLQISGHPWPAAEDTIVNSRIGVDLVTLYAKNFLKDRWPAGEKLLLDDAEQTLDIASELVKYASQVIKGRWKEAEKYIIQNPDDAAIYAREVIKGRWKEAEPRMIEVDPRDDANNDIEKYFKMVGNVMDYYSQWPEVYQEEPEDDDYY